MIYYNGEYTAQENIISYNDCGFTTAIGIFDSMLALNRDCLLYTSPSPRDRG